MISVVLSFYRGGGVGGGGLTDIKSLRRYNEPVIIYEVILFKDAERKTL